MNLALHKQVLGGFCEEDINNLKESLKKSREKYDAALNNINFVTDSDLIEHYIYEMKSAQMQYEYIYKKLKTRCEYYG